MSVSEGVAEQPALACIPCHGSSSGISKPTFCIDGEIEAQRGYGVSKSHTASLCARPEPVYKNGFIRARRTLSSMITWGLLRRSRGGPTLVLALVECHAILWVITLFVALLDFCVLHEVREFTTDKSTTVALCGLGEWTVSAGRGAGALPGGDGNAPEEVFAEDLSGALLLTWLVEAPGERVSGWRGTPHT